MKNFNETPSTNKLPIEVEDIPVGEYGPEVDRELKDFYELAKVVIENGNEEEKNSVRKLLDEFLSKIKQFIPVILAISVMGAKYFDNIQKLTNSVSNSQEIRETNNGF